jgi:tetratricopeptide (TPR) repeat protein
MNRCASLAIILAVSVCAACSSGVRRAPVSVAERVDAPAKPVPPSPPSASPANAQSADPEQRFAAALQLMHEGRNAEARGAFLGLIRDYPGSPGALTNLGILYARDKQYPQAITSLSRAVELNPANAIALNWLGICHRDIGQGLQAEGYYRKAIAVRPGYAAAHLNLGILYEDVLRRPAAALEQYRQYRQLTDGDRAMVDVWIRNLEAIVGPSTADAGAPP